MKRKKLVVILFALLLVSLSAMAAYATYLLRYDSGGTFYENPHLGPPEHFEYGNGAGESPCWVWQEFLGRYVERYGEGCYYDYDLVRITYDIDCDQCDGPQAGTKTLSLADGSLQVELFYEPLCGVAVRHDTINNPLMEHNEFMLYEYGDCYFETSLTEIQWERWD